MNLNPSALIGATIANAEAKTGLALGADDDYLELTLGDGRVVHIHGYSDSYTGQSRLVIERP